MLVAIAAVGSLVVLAAGAGGAPFLVVASALGAALLGAVLAAHRARVGVTVVSLVPGTLAERDPVCGRVVEAGAPVAALRVADVTYRFCSETCAAQFEEDARLVTG